MSDELADLEEALAAQDEEHETARRAQLRIDLAAFVAARGKYGKGGVARVNVISWSPGIPTLAIVRLEPNGIKRYRFMVKPTEETPHPDHAAAAEALADVSVVYPPKGDGYEALCDARPGVKIAMGIAASNLAAGKIATEGKG